MDKSIAKNAGDARHRRTLTLLAACTTLALALCCIGCVSGSNPSSPASSDATASTSTLEPQPKPEPTSGVVTMSDYLSERYASFDTFDEGIRSGSEIPQSLRLFVQGTLDGSIYDDDDIVWYWDALSKIHIDLDHPIDKGSHSEYISFSFDSGREIIPFPFNSSDYADFSDGTLYPVADPEDVAALVDSLTKLVMEQRERNQGTVPMEGDVYLWDADGDGNPERLAVMFNDNGDEAPSTITLNLYGFVTNVDAEAFLEGAYGIDAVESGEDEAGPYLLVSYQQGDYYNHDHQAQCRLRLVDGQLEVTEL